MGCDIHAFVEVRLDEDRWNAIAGESPYHKDDTNPQTWEELAGDDPHIAASAYYRIKYAQLEKLANPVVLDWIYKGRNYNLFAVLADVRNGRGFAGVYTGEGFIPISDPKGMPNDASYQVLEESEHYGVDGHSHSFFTLTELEEYDWDQETFIGAIVPEAMAKEFDETGELPEFIPLFAEGPTRRILQPVSYRESAGPNFWETIETMKGLCERFNLSHDDIRLVFFFDN